VAYGLDLFRVDGIYGNLEKRDNLIMSPDRIAIDFIKQKNLMKRDILGDITTKTTKSMNVENQDVNLNAVSQLVKRCNCVSKLYLLLYNATLSIKHIFKLFTVQ